MRYLLFLLALPSFATYSQVATISISHLRAGSSDLTDYVLLVGGSYPQMATIANGGLVTSASGYDVVFTSDSGCSSKLNWETEYWDAHGNVAYHVEIPTLSHTTDNVLYACIGNAAVTTDQSNKTGTWDSTFAGVWHLPNGSTLTANDSTANANNASTNTAAATSGQIDGAASFNGSAALIVPDSASLQASAFTVEFWLYLSGLPYSYEKLFYKGTPWYIEISNNNQLGLSINGDYGSADLYYVSAGWTHVAAAYDGSGTVNVYLNGSVAGSRSTGAISLDSTALYVGENSYGGQLFAGKLDEIRFENVVRPANWIAAAYANQLNPSSFYSINFPVPGAIPTGRPILW